MGITINPDLGTVISDAIRIRPYEFPSQWMDREYYLSALSGTENPGKIDIWRMPVNVGIVDGLVEHKRGLMIQKPAQSGVSTYIAGGVGYLIARHGGAFCWTLAKIETAREHAVQRWEPMFEKSTELSELMLQGTKDRQTILGKLFSNGRFNMNTSATENNFISQAYWCMVLDEFGKMGIFPSGRDPVQLSRGRQLNMTAPLIVGLSTPDTPETDICAYVEHDSDKRAFFWRCPHCKTPIDPDPEEHIRAEHEDNSTIIIPASARLVCPSCYEVITDGQRARAILHAAQAACPWYLDVPYDDQVGWQSLLEPAEAAEREYAGFTHYSHLLNPAKTTREIAEEMRSMAKDEATKKTVMNDVLGKGHAPSSSFLSVESVEQCATRQADTVPVGTWNVTCGMDIQGGGDEGVIGYYDISAWSKTGHKTVLRTGRIFATRFFEIDGETVPYGEIDVFVNSWTGRDDEGASYQLNCFVIDAGWRARLLYPLCNRISGRGQQWACPVVYSDVKAGGASYKAEQQSSEIGDPARKMWNVSRDWLVSRAIDRIMDERVTLPMPIPEELARHYTANVQSEKYDRNGNFVGFAWKKRQLQHGERVDDDYLQAACYAEFAAILLGLESLMHEVVVGAEEKAEDFTRRRDANRSAYYASRQRKIQERMRQRNRSAWHDRRANRH